MSNFAAAPPADAGAPTPALSDDQVAAFWASIVANLDAAREMARVCHAGETAEDVVNSAALLFLESFSRPGNPAPFPRTDEDFRLQYLAIVRNHTRDCVRKKTPPARPKHSHWGDDPAPYVGGRKLGDRELDGVFARNSKGKYDMLAPDVEGDGKDLGQLCWMLNAHTFELPLMQRQVIELTFFEGMQRAEVAELLDISVNTYDNHLRAGLRRLREDLANDFDTAARDGHCDWSDVFAAMQTRYDARCLRRASRIVVDGSITRRRRRRKSRAGAETAVSHADFDGADSVT